MQEVSTSIEYKGKSYKLVFNLNTMEEIQEEYGSLTRWGDLTEGNDGREVDIKALKFGFKAMLNEGIDISNDEEGKNEPFLTSKFVGRMLTDIGFDRVTEEIKSVVVESTASDEKNE